jgi:hypothetical protein
MPKPRGLSIAEVLLATTLLAGMAVSLFGVWALHARATAQSREQLTAGCWADQVMEEALSQGYTVTNQTVPNPPFRMAHIVEGERIYSDYYYRTYVDENPTPTNPGLKDVTVEVWWQHGDQWRSIKLVTRLGWQG